MNDKTRVLGYHTAKIISDDELTRISGGSGRLSMHPTQQVTGSYPGTTDVTFDQQWD